MTYTSGQFAANVPAGAESGPPEWTRDQEHEFYSGWIARDNGVERSDNPHRGYPGDRDCDEECALRVAWNEGWLRGESEAQKGAKW